MLREVTYSKKPTSLSCSNKTIMLCNESNTIMRAKRFRGKNSVHSPAASKTIKQSFKATLGQKQMSNECAKLIQCRKAGAKNMNIKLYFSSSDQICDIGMSSREKAFLKKEKRQLKKCFSIFSLIHPSILL